jgi:hypothetical protein
MSKKLDQNDQDDDKKHDVKNERMLSRWLKNEMNENPDNFSIISDLPDDCLLEFIKLRKLPPLTFQDFWQCNHSRILNDIMNTAWDWSVGIPDKEKITRDQLMFLALVWNT